MPDRELLTVSASQAAALFDCSPYLTKWLLWRVFSGVDQLPDLDAEENERMLWGTLQEPIVFHEAMKRLDMEGRYNEAQDYTRHSSLPLGCTLDGVVFHPTKGRCVVQIKCVDWIRWKEGWTDDQPPPHITCQVQAEMMVIGAEWAVIPCLIGGNELRLYEMDADPEFMRELAERSNEFMRSVAAGDEPDPLGVPMERPKLLTREYMPEETIDLTESEEAFDAIQALRSFEPRKSEAEKEIKKAKAKLLALSGGAGRIHAHGYGCEIAITETPEAALALPPEVRLGLESALKSGDLQEDDADAVDAARTWRKITRKAGHRTLYKTWARPEEGPAPWLKGFDADPMEGG